MAANNHYTKLFGVPYVDPSTTPVAVAPGVVDVHIDSFTQRPYKQILLYVPSALQGVITSGAPYVMTYSGTDDQNPQVALASASTSGVTRDVVILKDSQQFSATMPTTGQLGWFAFWGNTKAYIDGTSSSIAAGSFLKLDSRTSNAALILDGATQSANSVAIYMDSATVTTKVLANVFLLGDKASID